MAFGDSRLRSTFSRCKKIISVEESKAGLDKYGRNMQMKRILYQRAAKKLISISWKDLDRIEEILAEKLSRYIRL